MILWLLPALAAPALETAAITELGRAQADLRLPDAPPPYLVVYDVLDGQVATCFAEGGAVISASQTPYRNLRAEVRVGDHSLDSSNFFAFGEPEGVVARPLPVEDDVLALRREIWLATDAAYKFAVEQYSRKVAARRGDQSPRPADYTAAVATVGEEVPAVPADATAITALATRLSGVLSEFDGIEVGQAVSRDWQGRRLAVTSEGTRRWSPTGFTVVRVEGTARLDDGSVLTDARWWVARRVSELPPEDAMIAEVREMGAWLSALREAPVEDDYLGPVLFEAPASAELFSQLLAAEIVGTPLPEEDSGAMAEPARPPLARIGRRLLPLGWTVVDDAPAHPDAVGAYGVDQEGVAPRRVELVRDGVLRDVLMSRIPRRDLAGSTGHGRSLGNERRAAMPAVVEVTPKRSVGERRLRRAALRLAAATGRDYVLVVRRIVPPGLTESIDVSFSGEGPPPGLTPPYEAYRLYADGREVPVRSLQFSGVDRRVLRDIVLAGELGEATDMLDGPPGPARFSIGPTGGLPVTWNAPPVLIAEMELTGNAGGEPRALVVPPRR